MILGIIRNETNKEDYYINLNVKDNESEISITHVNDQGVESLKEKEAINLLKILLSSKLTYKGKEEDYDIYLDEANNKRYFKDGKENYFKFLENNGTDAIMYLTKISKKHSPRWQKIVVGGIVFTIIISSSGLIHLANKVKYVEEPQSTLVSIEPISSEEMINLINESQNLSEEEKQIIAQQTYFQFILNNADSETYSHKIRNAFTDISIKEINDEVDKTTFGYYNPVDINTIHMRIDMRGSKEYEKVLAHEFIHMTQVPNQYRYIQEGCAEIIRKEFFNQPYYGYGDMLWRIKILMEIIGPQPVIDCNYQSDPKSFEESIKKYLNEQDAERLLELFTTTAQSHYQSAEELYKVNDEIDELLSKMYTKKTGKSIKEDKLIQDMYNSNDFTIKRSVYDRTYFNANSANYNSSSIVVEETKTVQLNIEDALKENNIKEFRYMVQEKKTVGDKTQYIPTIKITTDFSEIPTKGLIQVQIIFNDGSKGLMFYESETGKWSSIDYYQRTQTSFPSIPEKFPEQAQKPITYNKSTEIEKSEAKSI